ncbi:hypothetical protein ACHAXT_008000 [Thalassiosira profunda]
MAPPDPPSSSAATAKEISALLRELRRSQKKRRRRGIAGSRGDGSEERDDARRLEGLRKIYARLIAAGEFELGNGSRSNVEAAGEAEGTENASRQWHAWLSSQHELFLAHLAEGVADGRTTALRTFCGVVASSPATIAGVAGKSERISERLLNKLLGAAVRSRACLEALGNNGNDGKDGSDGNGNGSISSANDEHLAAEESILSLLEAEFVRPYRDMQYFILKGLKGIAQELLAGLDRVRTRAADAAKEDDEDDVDNMDGGEDLIAAAERRVGLAAENMCRLLLKLEDVPATAAGELEDEAGFLFSPPVLSEKDGAAMNEESDDEDSEEGDASDDGESSAEESSSDEESHTGTKKRPSSSNKQNDRKRRKPTKRIAWQRPYKHRFAHQEAWLAVLRLPNLPARTQKLVLPHLSTHVLTVCPSPLRFAEYFARSFRSGTVGGSSSGSSGSLVSVLSLQGLFVLMLDHQLEYPQFYDSLYRLLHPRILYTKHRTVFLRLLSQSLLSNSMLPAYVAAAFCKRLCRLALSGPPGGGLYALALVGNLLRKHPECACLVHRRGHADDGGLLKDAFVEDAADLADSRALESSLWELAALERHCHPAVAALAGAAGTEDDRTTPMHDLEDFAVHTYASLFETEKRRLGSSGGVAGGKKRKGRGGGRVSVTFVAPEGLFAKDDVFGDSFKKRS